jgi:hypothetical protein
MQCPYCKEEIIEGALKCKHCGSYQKELRWYFRTIFIVIAFCIVGPLVLPLIWWHPRISSEWKIALSIGILAFSCFLFDSTMDAIHSIRNAGH